MHSELSTAYRDGLRRLLDEGDSVPSVVGAKSKASNFGRGDRPWIELIAQQFTVHLASPQVVSPKVLPTHMSYLCGLLAWTLAGRDDLATLAYYRKSARDFSDDGLTMCGSFGARLFGSDVLGGQISAICDRLISDTSSRRTYAAIIKDSDNVAETLEYPCAAGVQLFLRDGKLHWLTIMRAQQALTILPYDTFLFSCLHQFAASHLCCETGYYTHFSGTFHIYENERGLARGLLEENIEVIEFPAVPSGHASSVAHELIALERSIREAAIGGDRGTLRDIAHTELRWEFNRSARRHLVDFAWRQM
jgi:thymidylate synthase